MSRWPRSTSHSRDGSSSMIGLLPPTRSRRPAILARSSASKPSMPVGYAASSCGGWLGSSISPALLRLHQAAIGAVLVDHLVMRAALHHAPALQYQYLVAVTYGAQAMRDHEAAAAAAAQLIVDLLLDQWIERRRRLVQQQ